MGTSSKGKARLAARLGRLFPNKADERAMLKAIERKKKK